MSDVIKMVRPKPISESQDALFSYLTGNIDNEINTGKELNLPQIVKEFEKFKSSTDICDEIPDVTFEYLTGLPNLSDKIWCEIAKKATFVQSFKNLQTFKRHNVFDDENMVNLISERLADKELIQKANVFPYQLLQAYYMSEYLPVKIQMALQQALEIATSNVPNYDIPIAICVDTSGSMQNSITGHRDSTTSKVNCVSVASLVACCVLRRNNLTTIVPFDTQVRNVSLNPLDSIVTNTKKLALNGGGTDCSCAMKHILDNNIKADLIFYISDNESWYGNRGYNRGTGVMRYFNEYKVKYPKTKLVCLDITPTRSTQVNEEKDCYNIGGFSDTVFDLLNDIISSDGTVDYFVKKIESIDLTFN
jgi:60 kDa SS-A/Ro ribonucleoprotein